MSSSWHPRSLDGITSAVSVWLVSCSLGAAVPWATNTPAVTIYLDGCGVCPNVAVVVFPLCCKGVRFFCLQHDRLLGKCFCPQVIHLWQPNFRTPFSRATPIPDSCFRIPTHCPLFFCGQSVGNFELEMMQGTVCE